jgi:hypothetical protein
LPGQGGRNHINERFATYWKDLFFSNKYVLVDWIRAKIWNNAHVVPCYAQNTYLYIKEGHDLLKIIAHDPLLDVVHPRSGIRAIVKNQLYAPENQVSSTWLIKKGIGLGFKRGLRRLQRQFSASRQPL